MPPGLSTDSGRLKRDAFEADVSVRGARPKERQEDKPDQEVGRRLGSSTRAIRGRSLGYSDKTVCRVLGA